MYNILPAHKRAAAANYIVPHQQPFEVLYRLNCDNLCADFQEDLSFRFSYGITALIQRFQGKNTNRIALKNPPQYTPVWWIYLFIVFEVVELFCTVNYTTAKQ